MSRHIRKRRHMKAQQKHDKQCDYAIRMQFRTKFFKFKNRGE